MAAALGEIGDPSAIPTLLLTLKKERHSVVRAEAAMALGKLGDVSVIPHLLAALGDESLLVVGTVAAALRELGDTLAGPEMADRLASPLSTASDRRAAAVALGELGYEPAVGSLVDALADSNAEVRESAARALGKLGDREAPQAISSRLNDEDAEVRRAAVWVYGRLGAAEEIKQSVAPLGDDENFGVRRQVKWVLEDLTKK